MGAHCRGKGERGAAVQRAVWTGRAGRAGALLMSSDDASLGREGRSFESGRLGSARCGAVEESCGATRCREEANQRWCSTCRC